MEHGESKCRGIEWFSEKMWVFGLWPDLKISVSVCDGSWRLIFGTVILHHGGSNFLKSWSQILKPGSCKVLNLPLWLQNPSETTHPKMYRVFSQGKGRGYILLHFQPSLGINFFHFFLVQGPIQKIAKGVAGTLAYLPAIILDTFYFSGNSRTFPLNLPLGVH